MSDAEPTSEARWPRRSGSAGPDVVSTTPERSTIGWPRAIATGLAVIIVGFAGAVARDRTPSSPSRWR